MKFFIYLSNYFSNRETIQEIFLIPVIATLLAIFLGLLLLIVSGSSTQIALTALVALFTGSFGSLSAISETFTAATPLIFAALGIAGGPDRCCNAPFPSAAPPLRFHSSTS